MVYIEFNFTYYIYTEYFLMCGENVKTTAVPTCAVLLCSVTKNASPQL